MFILIQLHLALIFSMTSCINIYISSIKMKFTHVICDLWQSFPQVLPNILIFLYTVLALHLCLETVPYVRFLFIYLCHTANFHAQECNFPFLLILTWLTLCFLISPDLESRLIVRSPLLVLDYRWSHNPPTYRRTVTPNWCQTHTVPKFGLQSSWITGACHYTCGFYQRFM